MREHLRKLWNGLLLAALLVVLVPQVVSATGADVGGTLEDITNTGIYWSASNGTIPDTEVSYRAGEGTVTWTPAPKDTQGNVTGPAVLTLNNATITADGVNEAIDIRVATDINVQVIGTNKLSNTDNHCIYLQSTNSTESQVFTFTGGGTLTAESTEYDSICIEGNMKVVDVTLSAITPKDSDYIGIQVLDGYMEVENATISCQYLLVEYNYYQKSGMVNCSKILVADSLKVDTNATLNALLIGVVSTDEMQLNGTVNSFVDVLIDDDTERITAYGNAIIDGFLQEAFASLEDLGDENYTLIFNIPEGANVTVPEGITFDLSASNLTFDVKGTLVVEGTVTLPASTTAEDIAKMNITGDGVVKVEAGTDTEEQIYTTSGTKLNVVSGLDFTNVGTGEGQTPATDSGYTWDAATKTLTLSNAYISGSLNLPADSKIGLNGASVVTGDVTVAGTVSDAFTLSGEGTLASAGGRKYVSHAYGEPKFTWTKTADGYTVKATFTCQGGEDTQTVDAKVTSAKQNATCTAAGEITYTAKALLDGIEYTDYKKDTIPMLEHDYDRENGTVTVQPTTTAEGIIEYKCKNCTDTITETVPKLKEDTSTEKPPTEEEDTADPVTKITDETILNTKSDNDISGSSFSRIQARADKTTKNTIRLRWNKVKDADGYIIYGNQCGTKNKYKKIKTITKKSVTTYTHKKLNGKKLKKGTYYKYIVRAYKNVDGQKVTIAASKTIHATTTGGKYGNAKSVKLKTDSKLKYNKKTKKYTLTLKKDKKTKKYKKYTLKASQVKQSGKIKKHRAIAYESTNKAIATVSKKGVVQAKKKGTCYIYVYAQNGVYQKITVKVK